jgi:hypothetical protein
VTPRQLFSNVLQDIGVLGKVDRLESNDAEMARGLANDWIDSLALEGMTVYYLPRTTKALAANTKTYTIGTGGAINIVRPVEIERAALILDTSVPVAQQVEKKIAVFTEDDYARIPMKDLTSPYVEGIYFDKSWNAGLGLITVHPVPTIATTTLVIYTRQALAEYADLTTDVTYPPGYRYFIRTALRQVFATGWGKSISGEQAQEAKDARVRVKRGNIRPEVSEIDPMVPGVVGGGGGYDWRTDEGA